MARVVILCIALAAISAVGCNTEYVPNAALLLEQAFLCFNNKFIYSKCAEAYRLNQNGDINVPPAATDQFCYGPCLPETHLVLDCVDHAVSNFKFYNKATIQDIRATLQAGCSQTTERGNFNVEEHNQDESSNADSSPPTNNLFTTIFAGLVVFLKLYDVLFL
ncbi:hypothetical protein Nepgr_001612 [Nepenthes gracilis]|uniref:DUF7731 domain-containing protein n=1 Tax=Nepenthes gracilis TaxID=150966 RepID=A0AAD3P5E3_NEPGR|nr:hypothetical protein Nepgr_001612 [Nepenthes gracilis]